MKKANNKAIEIARLINDFLSHYAPTHITKSSHTIRSYKMTLSLYLSFLEEIYEVSSETLSAEYFERDYIEKWIEWLSGVRSCSTATCNVRLGALRTFLKYVGSKNPEYLYLFNDSTKIPSKKVSKTKVEGMSKNAVNALFAVPNTATMTGIRDLVLMLVMYSTAARIDEVLSIKLKNIYLDTHKPYITIIGKGDKTRTLYLLPKVASYIEKYLTFCHIDRTNPEAYLFYSKIKGVSQKMTQPAVDKRLKAIAAKAKVTCEEVPVELHAHQFRHAKASHWLESGMNIVQISFLLGHENMETTMKFLDITLESERKALQTLENAVERKIKPKWNQSVKSLRELCK